MMAEKLIKIRLESNPIGISPIAVIHICMYFCYKKTKYYLYSSTSTLYSLKNVQGSPDPNGLTYITIAFV